MRIYFLSSFLILLLIFLHCSALPWTQGYLKYGKNNFIYLQPSKFWNYGLNREPNCDELRAMWRFSMVKSRRTEITNEVPIYRDPFAYNIWEPRARSKHLQSSPLAGIGLRGSQNHVYGKIVHSVPSDKYSEKLKVNGRSFDDMAKFFTSEKPITPRRKNAEAFRLPNGAVSFRKVPALTDSFQKLKAVVRAQRAKELQEQHLADPHRLVKNVSNGNLQYSPSFEYLYNANASLSGKRNLASKTLHFIANPSSFAYGSPKYYDQFLADHYISDYAYYFRPHAVPLNLRYSMMPVNMPARY